MIRHLMIFTALGVMFTACATSPPVPTVPPSPEPTATATASLTPVPTSTGTPTAQPTATETPAATEPAVNADGEPLIDVEPLFLIDLPSPLELRLPEDWRVLAQNAALPLPEEDTFSLVMFEAYSGAVTGGTGTITVLWGFSNMVALSSTGFDLWADGYRLLLFALLEPDCRVGRNPQVRFEVGGYEAVGSEFWAVDCGLSDPDDDILPSPDIQGWFAALQVDGMNFAFYAYTHPRAAIVGSARAELQDILSNVIFDVDALRTEN